MDKSQTRAPHNRLNRRVVNPTASLTQTLYKRRSCLIHRLYYPTRHPLYEWATLRPITSPSPCRSPHHKQHDHFTGGPSKRRRPPKARTIVVENEDEGEDEREDEYNNHKISATRTKVWSRTVFLKTPLPARLLPSFPNSERVYTNNNNGKGWGDWPRRGESDQRGSWGICGYKIVRSPHCPRQLWRGIW